MKKIAIWIGYAVVILFAITIGLYPLVYYLSDWSQVGLTSTKGELGYTANAVKARRDLTATAVSRTTASDISLSVTQALSARFNLFRALSPRALW